MAAVKQVAVLDGHTERVWFAAWSPDGTQLATCAGDKRIVVWTRQGEGWAATERLEEHSRTVRQLAWSPSGRYLCAASFDGTTSVFYRSKTDRGLDCVATLEGHENEVKSVAWDSSETMLATCGRDKSVWIWSLESEEDHDFECAAVLQGHSQDVKMVKWHPTRPMLFSVSYDDSIRVWLEDGDDWYCADTLTGHDSTVWAISFHSSGERFVTCSADLTLKIWRIVRPADNPTSDKLAKYEYISTVGGYHTRPIYHVDWSPVHDCIVSSSEDDSFRIFAQDPENTDPATGIPAVKPVWHQARAHDLDVNCAVWNGSLLATVGDDRRVKIWEVDESSLL